MIVISQGIQALVLASENQELEKLKKKKMEKVKRVGKAGENLRNLIPLWIQMVGFCRAASRGSSGSVSKHQLPGCQEPKPPDKQNNEPL